MKSPEFNVPTAKIQRERRASTKLQGKFDTFSEVCWERFGRSPSSVFSRVYDQIRTARNDELKNLHRRIYSNLSAMQSQWSGYDFGHGYLYQDCPELRLSGRRSTNDRWTEISIQDYVVGKNVLDIGSNTGFLSLQAAKFANCVVGIDNNPFLVEIANDCSRFLNRQNTDFVSVEFEDFKETKKFNVILSLSNHFTYDGYVCGSISNFFKKCRALLDSGGLLIFESHPPKFEARGVGIEGVRREIETYFDVEKEGILKKGFDLDRGRTFFVARAKD